MKHSTFSKSALAVTAILVAAACANSADVPDDTALAATDPAPTSSVPPASKPAPTTPPEKKCVASCKADADCQNSCPALPGGIQCCDTESGVCGGSKTAACPPPKPKPVDPPPAGY